ncbi:MAG: hypothetical protein RR553_09010 [Akkermansia sp.]
MSKIVLFSYFTIGLGLIVCSMTNGKDILPTTRMDQPRGSMQGEDNSLRNRIQSAMETGNSNRIIGICRDFVRQKLERGKLNDETIGQALADKNLTLACQVARYFSSKNVQKNSVCQALKDKEYIQWLLERPSIFEELAFANRGNERTLDMLHAIWLKENKKLEGVILNLAIGASLNAGEETDEELIGKYDFYKQSHADGKLFAQFEMLKPWEMSIVLKTIESIGNVEDLAWAQNHLAKKPKITQDNIGQAACGLIPYRDKNKNGISVHAGGAFYDNKPITLKLYTEYGGVCGAVSKGCSGFCRAKGIPSYPIGQPGHCALIWRKPGGNWSIGNNVCGGWIWSEGNGPIPWKGPTALIQAMDHYLNFGKTEESNNAYYCSSLVQKPATIDQLIEYSLKQNHKNYPAWQSKLTRLNKKKLPLVSLLTLEYDLKEAFNEEPAVLEYLMTQYLAPNVQNLDAFQLSALMLNDVESEEFQNIYLRNLWKQALKDIPELKKSGIKYDHKMSSTLLGNWEKFYQGKKVKTKTKEQTCFFLEKAISSLTERKEMHGEMLKFYLQLISDWKDEKFMRQAGKFFEGSLQKSDNPIILKNMLDFGLKLDPKQQNKTVIKKYQEKLGTKK